MLRHLGAPWQGSVADLPALAREAGFEVVEHGSMGEVMARLLPDPALSHGHVAEVAYALLTPSPGRG